MKTLSVIKIVELRGKGKKSRRGLYVYVKNKGEKGRYYKYKENTKLEDYGVLKGKKLKEQNIIKKKFERKPKKFKEDEEVQEDDKRIKIKIKDSDKKNEKERRDNVKRGLRRITKSDKTARLMSQEKNLENLRNRLIVETIIRTTNGNEIARVTSIGVDPSKINKELEREIKEFNKEAIELDAEIKPSQKYQLLQKKVEDICKRNDWTLNKGVIQGIKLESLGIDQEINIIKK